MGGYKRATPSRQVDHSFPIIGVAFLGPAGEVAASRICEPGVKIWRLSAARRLNAWFLIVILWPSPVRSQR